MRGCQSIETAICGVKNGSGKLDIPVRKFSVWRSGTAAIRSDPQRCLQKPREERDKRLKQPTGSRDA